MVFESDYVFGTDLRKTKLETLSKRNEKLNKYQTDRTFNENDLFSVSRIWMIAEGYSVTFDKKGNIIKE